MSTLTSGRFGDGRTEGEMRNGTFLGAEQPMSGDSTGSVSGIVIDGASYALGGQPPAHKGGTWGDMSWINSAFYRYPGLRC
jgi:hypothetical protein